MHLNLKRFTAIVALAIAGDGAYAGSATWNLNPVNNHWNKAQNWTPATVPYGENDVATFETSNVTDIKLGLTPNGDAGNILGSIVFEAGASAYTVTMTAVLGQTSYVEFHGAGIANNSGTTQNVIAARSAISDSARIYFFNSSSAGENVVITNQASAAGIDYGAFTSFDDTSTAGNATIINEGASVSGTIYGGFADLLDYSSSESATFINNPGTVGGAAAGHTLIQTFLPGGQLGTSTFIANPATVSGAEGGWVEMDVGTCAGTSFIANGATVADCQAGQIYVYGAEYGTGLGVATFTGNGGNGTNAQGGLIDVFNLPLSDQTVVIANAGTNGGLGGTILIEGDPLLDPCQFQVFGNGTLDLTNATGTIAIGSLSGSGIVLLDGHSLTIGSNNFDSTFSGVIQESGALSKAGTGTLTLPGANTYTGATTVSAGTLIASNVSSSATGTGAVNVNAGTLGGRGIIAGATTIGTGSGPGAFLAPAAGTNVQATLTIQSALTFKADATYTCTFRAKRSRAKTDKVIAKGVTINSGVMMALSGQTQGALRQGLVMTLISNTSANPISGTFSNLPDGGIVTINGNTSKPATPAATETISRSRWSRRQFEITRFHERS
jgi:autotransporter-associated beta strand protein